MMRNAYLYMRFSSIEQAKGDSLPRQRLLASEYIARHPEKGLRLNDDEFIDEGVSSFAGQNLQPGRALHRFLDEVKSGRVQAGSVLMVESLDRLSRQQVLDSQALLLDLLISNINVITTSPAEEREYSRASGLTDLIVSLAGMERANQESAIKSDRVRQAWKRKKANADIQKLTRRAPAWLRLSVDRKKFEVIEERSAAVKRIFELADSMGQHAIARLLNEEGIKPLLGDRGWHSSSVVKLLSSTTVIGTYQPHQRDRKSGKRVPDGPPIPNYYPAIVDEQTYYRIQAMRAARKTTGAGRKGVGFSNLFTGIAKCAVCSGPVVMVNKGQLPKGGAYLVCSAARRGLGCKYHAVRYGQIEDAFFTLCREIDVSKLLPNNECAAESVRLGAEQAALRGELVQKRSLIDRLASSIATIEGRVAQSINDKLLQYHDELNELESRAQAIAESLLRAQATEARSYGLHRNFLELVQLIQRAPDVDRYVLRSRFNALLKEVLSEVTVGKSDGDLATELDSIVASSAERLAKANAEVIAILEGAGISHHRKTSGSLSVVRVTYKSGWAIDLAIDRYGLIGFRRMRVRDDAKLDEAPRSADSGWGIVVAVSAQKQKAIPSRGAGGRFVVPAP